LRWNRSAGFLFRANHSFLRRGLAAVAMGVALPLLTCARTRYAPDPSADSYQTTDEAGRTITLPVKVTRFVSLAPNLTEIVLAIGAGAGLGGRTTYCNYPAEAQKVEVVGDTLKPSIERIIALR